MDNESCASSLGIFVVCCYESCRCSFNANSAWAACKFRVRKKAEGYEAVGPAEETPTRSELGERQTDRRRATGSLKYQRGIMTLI